LNVSDDLLPGILGHLEALLDTGVIRQRVILGVDKLVEYQSLVENRETGPTVIAFTRLLDARDAAAMDWRMSGFSFS
jgi:hypothetical protein